MASYKSIEEGESVAGVAQPSTPTPRSSGKYAGVVAAVLGVAAIGYVSGRQCPVRALVHVHR